MESAAAASSDLLLYNRHTRGWNFYSFWLLLDANTSSSADDGLLLTGKVYRATYLHVSFNDS